MKTFDPRKFIDRKFEQELFENLLTFSDKARVLAIEDSGGMGKSHLLERFQYRCRTVKPRTPVSHVALDQLPDASPLTLVQIIAKDLARLNISFPSFDHYEAARKAHDFSVIRGSVDLRGANLSGAKIDVAGIMTKVEQSEIVMVNTSRSTLTPEQLMAAEETSIQAFLEDLKAVCTTNTAVIMLDAFEKCDFTLQKWLIDTFLERSFFDLKNRPEKVLLVVAGREIPDFELYWSIDDCASVVKSIRGLSKWDKEHVAECLRVHGLDYTPQHLNTFFSLIEMGHTPFNVVNLIKTTLSIHKR